MLILPTPKFRKRRDPAKRSPVAQTPVVSVANVTQADDPPGVIWTFNRAIASVTLPIGGLTTDGNPVTGLLSFEGSELIVSYDSFPEVGDPWQTHAPVTGITFVGGGSVAAQSGIVQAAP